MQINYQATERMLDYLPLCSFCVVEMLQHEDFSRCNSVFILKHGIFSMLCSLLFSYSRIGWYCKKLILKIINSCVFSVTMVAGTLVARL